MTFEDKFDHYKKNVQIPTREEAIQRTVKVSEEAFFKSEQEGILSYREFLWIQSKVIRKRWWIRQFLILFVLWIVLAFVHDETYIKRSMGVAASLFVVLAIPELWKNRSCSCMEIEAASYYSLKQVYAARMLLFGIADLFFITLFLGTASAGLHYELLELVIQFLFPLCVTACICFGILCSKFFFSETAATILCILWSAVWLFIVLDEGIYTVIMIPIWFALLGFAMLFLAFTVYRTLKRCDNYLEVSFYEIGTE